MRGRCSNKTVGAKVYAVIRGREDNDVRGVVVHRFGEGDDVMCLYTSHSVRFANKFARHLATEAIELFQRIANGSVKLAHFLQASDLFDASALVLTRFEGFKVES